MPDTSMTEGKTIPPIGASVQGGESSPSDVSYPVGTMIQHDGVDVSDDYTIWNVDYEVSESPNKTLNLSRTTTYEKNGVVVNVDEPTAINFETNLNISESPSNALLIVDPDYQINGASKQYGAKALNFLGRKLLYDSGIGDLIFNACGDGYFGDGSDGDANLNGVSTNPTVDIVDVLPIETLVTSVADGTFTTTIDYNMVITMDSPFDSGDLTLASEVNPKRLYWSVSGVDRISNILEISSGSTVILNAAYQGEVDTVVDSAYIARKDRKSTRLNSSHH